MLRFFSVGFLWLFPRFAGSFDQPFEGMGQQQHVCVWSSTNESSQDSSSFALQRLDVSRTVAPGTVPCKHNARLEAHEKVRIIGSGRLRSKGPGCWPQMKELAPRM